MIDPHAKPPLISTAPHTFHLCDSLEDSSPNLRKRKSSPFENGEHSRRAEDDSEHLPDQEYPLQSKKKKVEVGVTCIRPPSFVYPRSAYDGHVPSLPRYDEKSVLKDILVS